MMLPIMVYMGLVAALLCATALVTERIVAELGRARRGVWLAALVVSIALPAASLLVSRGAPATVAEPASDAAPAVTPDPTETAAGGSADAAQRFTLPDWRLWPGFGDWYRAGPSSSRRLDAALAVAWVTGSAGVLLAYGLAWLGLRREAGRWPSVRLEGGDVSVSDRLGPAMFGLVRPRILVPSWLLDAPPGVRTLVLRHEHEHVAAKDQWLLAAALMLAALAPWNPALWWQLRRLRLAIEIDCDARVVRGGADALTYSEVLLAVRERRTATTPLAAVALTEPVSQLERRIRLVLRAAPRIRRPLITLSALLATASIVAACAIEPPAVEPRGAPDVAAGPEHVTRQPITSMRLDGERVVVLVDASSTMLDRTLAGVERRRAMTPEQRREAPKWRQAVDIVGGLTAQVRPGAQFQVIAFNDSAHSLVAGTDGEWLSADDGRLAARAVEALRERTPEGPSSLHAAFRAAGALTPAPDNVFLVTDGLPTAGAAAGTTSRDEQARQAYFEAALEALPAGAAINVILLAMEGDPAAAPAYWTLALGTGGSLLAPAPAEDGSSDAIAGVPVDSRYVAFVVDTSGSMRQYAWDRVQRQIRETLDAYPTVEGIQVLSDEGEYLFGPDRGEWIRDTPARREQIIDAVQDWSAFSNSSPREGILEAIDTLYVADAAVAIYVLGDDLARGSVNETLDAIADRNRVPATGARKVRVHSVAFPVYHEVTDGQLLTAANYASLMRELSQRNGGSFIGLAAESRARQ